MAFSHSIPGRIAAAMMTRRTPKEKASAIATQPDKASLVPGGAYRDLPFRCGHLEVELPPGCYWVTAGYVGRAVGGFIHFNDTTHVGIVEVGCDVTACVKLYNPTPRLCWDWFLAGLRAVAGTRGAGITAAQVREVENVVGGVLKDVPTQPIEETLEKVLADLVGSAKKQR